MEVRSELEGQEVELRFDPHEEKPHPSVFVDDHFVCDTVPLDRVANASRRRRRLRGEAAPDAEHYDRVRPVGQPSTYKKTNKKEE